MKLFLQAKAAVLLMLLLSTTCLAQTLEDALCYGLPVVVINTLNDEEPTAERVIAPEGCLGKSITNATKVPGRVRIYYPGDAVNPVYDSGEYEKDESGMTIKIRGNTSAMRPKNPFKIKLQKKGDLLMRGDPKYRDKEWALLLPTFGNSNSHLCPFATLTGNKITEVFRVCDWVPASMYVNLIVNNDYRGFYLLTETVKRNDKCRIDVDEETGYIAEIDPYWWNEDVSVESPILKNVYKFTFKYPDSDDITEGQLDAFREHIEKFNASLADGTYPLYVDVESCARWLLAHQLLGTLDAAGSNMFIIRRNALAKLQMGPLWDFDSAFRIQDTFTPVMSLHYFRQMLQDSPNKMLAREMTRIWETEKERIMTEVSAFLDSIAGTDLALAIDNSIRANHKRWPSDTKDDMSTTIRKLQDWFCPRAEELDSLMTTLNTADGTIKWESLPEGTFVLNGTERPVEGGSLSVSSSRLNLSDFTFRWTRGDAPGAFDSDVLSADSTYTITSSDYEHWLRMTICDQAGNKVYSKDTWISKLPVLYIDTDDGKPVTSKENYVTASFRVQGNAEFEQQYAGATKIRGRGTTSWQQYPQKPYKLKLDKKEKLFGFGKSKHWVLISNFNDKSCLRNYIASRLAEQLDVTGMKMTWVDVVLNGEAKGCYMLSQHIRVDKNSVDIFDWESEAEDVADALFDAVWEAESLAETDRALLEDTMSQNLSWITDGTVSFKGKTYNLSDYGLKEEYDISKGYLFEATAKKDGKSQFTTANGVHFEVHAPEYIATNSEMMAYATGFWNDFEAEYCQVPAPCKNFSRYADVESMVAVWLVNEIMGQGDLTNSRYSYIASDGKLHFGPVWDFDHATASWSTDKNVNFFYTLIHNLAFIYFRQWFPDPVLCQMAYDAYWDTARPFIMDFIAEGGELDQKYALFSEAGVTNDILWGSYPCFNGIAQPRTTAEDVELLRKFLLGHINWLDQQFQSVRTLIEAMNKVCTYPCDPKIIEDGIQTLPGSPLKGGSPTEAQKVIKDKHLYIIQGDKTYSLDGKRMK